MRRVLKAVRHPRLAFRYALRFVPFSIRLQVRTLLNVAAAAFHPVKYVRSANSVALIKRSLEDIARSTDCQVDKVPPVFHFVYGFKQREDFPYYAYLAIKSALALNPTFRAIVHFCHEPTGEWWEEAKKFCEVNQLPDFHYFGPARLYHYAHKADIVRLLALQIVGGIYLDLDTLTLRSFETFRDSAFVMGVQPTSAASGGGMCNAVLISKRRSEFISRWLWEYRHFRSKGWGDIHWDFHSVKLPVRLYFTTSLDIRVVSYTAFFPLLWHETKKYIFTEGGVKNLPYFEKSYALHLWNNFNNDELLRMSPQTIETSTSLYAHFARAALEAGR